MQVSGGGPYWLDIEAATATLDDIDASLRGIWLECCGHLSQFTVGPQPDWDDFGSSPVAGASGQPALSSLLEVGQTFGYTYDMGSSMELELTVQARESAYNSGDPVVLLIRNLPPTSGCSKCEAPAKWVHSWESDEETGVPAMDCGRHGRGTRDEQLPLVNSPAPASAATRAAIWTTGPRQRSPSPEMSALYPS